MPRLTTLSLAVTALFTVALQSPAQTTPLPQNRPVQTQPAAPIERAAPSDDQRTLQNDPRNAPNGAQDQQNDPRYAQNDSPDYRDNDRTGPMQYSGNYASGAYVPYAPYAYAYPYGYGYPLGLGFGYGYYGYPRVYGGYRGGYGFRGGYGYGGYRGGYGGGFRGGYGGGGRGGFGGGRGGRR